MSALITSVTFSLPAPSHTIPYSFATTPTCNLLYIFKQSPDNPLGLLTAEGDKTRTLFRLIRNKRVAAPGNTVSLLETAYSKLRLRSSAQYRRHILHPSSGLNCALQKNCSIMQAVRKGPLRSKWGKCNKIQAKRGYARTSCVN
jgi:hypothetical protein